MLYSSPNFLFIDVTCYKHFISEKLPSTKMATTETCVVICSNCIINLFATSLKVKHGYHLLNAHFVKHCVQWLADVISAQKPSDNKYHFPHFINVETKVLRWIM